MKKLILKRTFWIVLAFSVMFVIALQVFVSTRIHSDKEQAYRELKTYFDLPPSLTASKIVTSHVGVQGGWQAVLTTMWLPYLTLPRMT